jgi:hypothetical protein
MENQMRPIIFVMLLLDAPAAAHDYRYPEPAQRQERVGPP